MEDLFALIIFLIIFLVSVLESVSKARKKKKQEQEEAAAQRRAGARGEAAPAGRRPAPEVRRARDREPVRGAQYRPEPARPAPARPAPYRPEPARPTPAPPAPRRAPVDEAADLIRRRLEEMITTLPGRPEPEVREAKSLEEIEPYIVSVSPEEGVPARARAPRPAAPEGIAAEELVAPSERDRRRRRPPLPALGHLSLVQRAFVWAEILGGPAADREVGPTAPLGLQR